MNNRQTDIKGKRNVRGSVYPGAAPSPDVNESEARIWETVHDLIELARQPVGLEDVMNWNPTPDVMPDLTQMLEKEAARAMRDPKGRSSLVASAKRNIEQAYMISKVRNPRVLARFAVEMAYDYHYRLNVSATLDGTWVRRWKNGHDWINCYPGYPEQGLPIRQDELAMLGWSTARYAAEKLPADNIVEPYEGLKPTFGWAIDPTAYSGDADHRFRSKPITDSARSRSLIPLEADHRFRSKPITRRSIATMQPPGVFAA